MNRTLRLYRINIHDRDEGAVIAWAGSQDKAKAKAREMNEDSGEPSGTATIELVDFPTKKAEVLSWLNVYFTRNNG